MKIEFLSTVALITPDPAASRMLYSTRWAGRSAGMSTSIMSRSPVASPSGSARGRRPLRRASGPRSGRPRDRCPRSVSSSTLQTPTRSTQRHASSSKLATSCFTHPARNRGAKRSPGCSHRKARSLGSHTSLRSTTTIELGRDLLYCRDEHPKRSGSSLAMRGSQCRAPAGYGVRPARLRSSRARAAISGAR